MKLTTGIISKSQVFEELDFLVECALNKNQTMLMMLGWACKLPEDRLWQKMPVKPDQLRDWVDDKVNSGIYDAGAADLFAVLPDGSEFLFCHESDVHIESDDRQLLYAVAEKWLQKGYKVQCAFIGTKWLPLIAASQLI